MGHKKILILYSKKSISLPFNILKNKYTVMLFIIICASIYRLFSYPSRSKANTWKIVYLYKLYNIFHPPKYFHSWDTPGWGTLCQHICHLHWNTCTPYTAPDSTPLRGPASDLCWMYSWQHCRRMSDNMNQILAGEWRHSLVRGIALSRNL